MSSDRTSDAATSADATAEARVGRRRWGWWVAAGVAVFLLVVAALQVAGGGDGFATITASVAEWAYLSVFLLVFLDGICALFPGETTLTAASTLAATGDLSLPLVMLAGAGGAIAGDSALYWIARGARRRYRAKLAVAVENEKVASVLAIMGSSAPPLLVAGRYVPGMRFVVNATFGIAAHPYRHFLLWSAVGGSLWSVYTCGLAYLVATQLGDFPFASVVVSGTITTVAIAVVLLVARRRLRQQRSGDA
ncbi:SNARE associated Golgi protein [Beutenbergia cavernae DSM 12333]|uniref:SNARE associated Golgi protein n=1 Tax=Beutenbergia cavernae (strain ATCC BAA-8 / DSM 12333 / CCUG 43141 / JCM 11478 / NBRC 16432 / NCIMB 13614 / HKI 0122) TaxID=471853 RepID=C5C4Y2_BEUC1|nr:VTT domain-containing protein [Beutenbergia cavernae]ACQ80110.1 SNARE associated Golgi protein [Beutenbergia cavernae DSM 12333]